jgi:hypothetical protein
MKPPFFKPPPPETFKSKAFRPYVIALGQLALAWNELHEYLGYLFTSLMPEDKCDRAMHVWYSSTQDRAQRQMIRGALAARPDDFDDEFPKAVKDITWLLGQVHALEDARNNAVHSPLFRMGKGKEDEIIPFAIFGHSRAIKLAKRPDLLAEYCWCRDMALALRDYTVHIDHALTSAGASWPRRPSLPNRGQRKTRPSRPHQLPPK